MVVPGRAENETIKTVTSKFQLVHYLQNCALTTSGKQLPKWAYEQQEVSCNPNIRDKNALWNVEDNVFEKCEWGGWNNLIREAVKLLESIRQMEIAFFGHHFIKILLCIRMAP